MVYEPRTYRLTTDSDLVGFEVVVRETDLAVLAERDLSAEAVEAVRSVRDGLEAYVAAHPRFVESFVPLPVDADAPEVVLEMARAASAAGVGPMAAVAGAVAEQVARALAAHSCEVVVENGGDCFLVGSKDRVVALHAGASAVSGRVGILVTSDLMPVGVCTSSATVGPSVSLGRADAAAVIAESGALADAAASALGNRVHGAEDIDAAIAAVRGIPGVLGGVVVVGGAIGAWGAARLVPIAEGGPAGG